MVVNGEAEFVGSLAGKARDAIAQAAHQQPEADVRLSLAKNDVLIVTITNSQPAEVSLAISEDGLTTNVAGGENGGRTLHHSAVVRELRRVGEVRERSFSSSVPLNLDKSWNRANLRAVVLVQRSDTGKSIGAASLPLNSLPRAN
jgi:hypothetical protein